tara:strand:- start:1279 stop:1632 length:354 start_codon:yes stop_codon:yes gene_type:complete
MSTRATYEFISTVNSFEPNVVVYRHYDGYPEGAADWLKNVRTAEDFIRKNTEASITQSHDTHGDTDYRYIVTRGQKGSVDIVAKQRIVYDQVDRWIVIFNGSAEEFQRHYSREGAAA